MKALRTPGHGAAVIAVGGAGDGDARGRLPEAVTDQIGRVRIGRDAASVKLGRQHARHRIGATQRLEAAQAEARRFVLQPDRIQARLAREGGQIAQRRRLRRRSTT